MILPKSKLTVGELVPVEVKVYFHAGMAPSLDGLPMLGSAVSSRTPTDYQPRLVMAELGSWPAMKSQVVPGVHIGWPYCAVGMHRA